MAQSLRSCLLTQEMWSSIPGSGRPLEEAEANNSSILAWRIPWTESGELLSMRPQSQTPLNMRAHRRKVLQATLHNLPNPPKSLTLSYLKKQTTWAENLTHNRLQINCILLKSTKQINIKISSFWDIFLHHHHKDLRAEIHSISLILHILHILKKSTFC